MENFTSVLLLIFFAIIFLGGPYFKYAFKMWIYFKMHEAHNQKAVTRVTRKPRKPSRPAVR